MTRDKRTLASHLGGYKRWIIGYCQMSSDCQLSGNPISLMGILGVSVHGVYEIIAPLCDPKLFEQVVLHGQERCRST